MELYSKELLALSKSDRHYRKVADAEHSVKAINTFCGDKFTLQFDYSECAADPVFHGYGCAVSRATAALAADILEGKTWADIVKIADEVLAYLESGKVGDNLDKRTEIFAPVRHYPGRYDCAALVWNELRKYAFARQESE